MKKSIFPQKVTAWIFLAMLALIPASCSDDDDPVQAPPSTDEQSQTLGTYYFDGESIPILTAFFTETNQASDNDGYYSFVFSPQSADGTISYYDKDGKRIHKTKRVVHKRRPIKRSSKIVYTYDRNGEKTGGYKRYGNTTTQYDKHGNVIGKTRRSVNGSVFYYDEKGRKTRSFKRSFTGRITEYDKNNRRIGVYR